MKSTLLLLTLLLCLSAKAQFVKDDKFIGGAISFYSRHQPTQPLAVISISENRQFNFEPMFGVLVSDRAALGGTLGYWNSNYKSKSGQYYDRTNYRAFSVGVFASRYYSIIDRFLFALTADVNFERSVRNTEDNYPNQVRSSVHHDYSIRAGLAPQLLYFALPRLCLRGSFGNISQSFTKNLSTDLKEYTTELYLSGSFSLALLYVLKH